MASKRRGRNGDGRSMERIGSEKASSGVELEQPAGKAGSLATDGHVQIAKEREEGSGQRRRVDVERGRYLSIMGGLNEGRREEARRLSRVNRGGWRRTGETERGGPNKRRCDGGKKERQERRKMRIMMEDREDGAGLVRCGNGGPWRMAVVPEITVITRYLPRCLPTCRYLY